MKKILFIISLHNFDYISFLYSKKYLEEKGFTIILASKADDEEFKKETKNSIDIDLTIEEINVKDFQGIFLISETSSSKNYLNDANVNDILNGCARYNVFSGNILKSSKKEINEYLDNFLEIF